MQSITWSPELHNIVRALKKIAKQDIGSYLTNRKSSLSNEEKQAVIATFNGSTTNQATILGWWDG